VALQYFKENPFFSDPVLKKEYRYLPKAGVDDEKKDEWGVTDAQAAFSWDTNVDAQVPG
jgi:template-activating factor I